MNVELLEKVKQHILEEPKRLFMPSYVIKKGESALVDSQLGDRFPECGTIGCIAGWVYVLSGRPNNGLGLRGIAAGLLGIDSDQSERLFLRTPEGWSYEDGQKLWSGDGTPETAQLAAKRIDLFIASNGEE